MGLGIDLRSDSVTRPTPAMRAVIADAAVGDDGFGDDPEINALQDEVAALFGHEAALLTPSGCMANQLAVHVLVPRGDELIGDADTYVITDQAGMTAATAGVSTRTWPAGFAGGRSGLDVEQIAALIHEPGYHAVPTRTIAVENTHNRAGGRVLGFADLQALRVFADERDLTIHCDGARIWNAHVASGVPLRVYGQLFDTLSVCLSKGLGAPFGSLLIGSAERIDRAREVRRLLGGGLRQAGLMAAAGRYALAHHIERLADDHARARRVAEALAPFGVCDPAEVETNIVLARVPDAVAFVEAAGKAGVRVVPMSPTTVRIMTHIDIDDDAIDQAISGLKSVLFGR